MGNNEQRNSETASNFPQYRKEKKRNSTRRVVGVVGGTILAVAVAFGGGATLSQFPNTVSQTLPGQTTQIITQAAETTATPSANAVSTPRINTEAVASSDIVNINRGNQQRNRGGQRGTASIQEHH